jgi:hypothetical protein
MIWDERYPTNVLRDEHARLVFEHALEGKRDVIEGHLHTVRGAVVPVVARTA